MMPINGEKATIREVYALIHQVKDEILDEVKSLRAEFMTMEAGRLSKLEKEFAEMKGADKVRVSMTAGIVSAVISLGLFIANEFLP